MCCYQSQNYKIWKQFTTLQSVWRGVYRLLSITKLQNLKAIHNTAIFVLVTFNVVINHKTTKFESNSQHDTSPHHTSKRCYQSQNCKIWKQFTTIGHQKRSLWELLSITKLQNLKAIHNFLTKQSYLIKDVINHKTTKFESNSQPTSRNYLKCRCCYQSQNYKIWKQFTTQPRRAVRTYKLLSITKLQNLKAIHNIKLYETNKHYVVINHKTTKFESNLQPLPKCSIFCNVVINHKTTKIESNSQLFCIKEF